MFRVNQPNLPECTVQYQGSRIAVSHEVGMIARKCHLELGLIV